MTLVASHVVVVVFVAAAAAVDHLDEAQQTLLHLPVYICPDLVYNANPIQYNTVQYITKQNKAIQYNTT